MPLVIRDWVVTGFLAATFIFVLKTLVLATPAKNIPGLPQFAATV